MTTTTTATGTLCDYSTGETIREATAEETPKNDGGAGVIKVDGRSCYVQGGEA